MVIGHLYKIKIYATTSDWVHGHPQIIMEIAIPEHNLTYNCHNNVMSVFAYSEERHKSSKHLKDVEMTVEFINDLARIKNLYEEINLLKDKNINDITEMTKNNQVKAPKMKNSVVANNNSNTI